MAITEYFIRYLQRRDTLSDRDLKRLRSLKTEQVSYAPGDLIISSDRSPDRSCMMLRGMSARSHKLAGRPNDRVITALHVPGDFVDLHGFVLSGLEHDVIAMGAAEVEFIRHEELTEITENFPHLTRLLWMATLIDAAMHRQWLVAASSLRSSAHLAHLLCEIYVRLNGVGAAGSHKMTLPVLQREFAEILGYSPIHINRAVRDLRDRGLVRWVGVEIEIIDWGALTKLAQFDPSYLDMEMAKR